MKKILLIIYLVTQNSLLFAAQTDTLTIHENETKLLTHRYFLELEDPGGIYNVSHIISNNHFHPVGSVLPVLKYSKSATWLKFVLKNKTRQFFVPITVHAIVIDNFDLYFTDPLSHRIIKLSSDITDNSGKLMKQNFTLINCNIAPDSTRTIYLRIKSSASSVIPIDISSQDSFLKNINFENIIMGGFIGVILVMGLYNLMLFITVKDKNYLYYVIYIASLGFTQSLLRGYGVNLFLDDKSMLNNYYIPLSRVFFGYAILLFAAEFLQLKQNIKPYFKYYYLLYVIYTIALIAIIAGRPVTGYNTITIAVASASVTLLFLGAWLYYKGFEPAKYFMFGWGLTLVAILLSIARNKGLIAHNGFTSNIIIYSSVLELILFSVALADKINFYRRQNNESQLLSLTIAKENERLITQQNILLETEVNARTQELIATNRNLSDTIENLKSAQIKLIETEKMASLGQLTAGVAHEINNPINFVSANIEPLRLDFLEIFELLDKYKALGDYPEKKDELLALAEAYEKKIDLSFIKDEILSLLEGIEEGANRTTEIVQSLRTFSRTDELVLKPADINKAILTTLILLRSSIPYNIEIKPVLNKLELLNCYPGKINQVFMNLVNNSIQAIKAKEVQENESIMIITADHPENITIEISDTGIGMSNEIRQHIFDPFFTTKNVGEGTGLGLSIVFGIIEDHHGTINVQSEQGKGTVFTITLPKTLE